MDVKDTHPLTIGEFGRRSDLSTKALRLYDVSGLLRPARVDPVSGYRQYAADQLDRACWISLLRQLNMPPAVIAEVLAGRTARPYQARPLVGGAGGDDAGPAWHAGLVRTGPPREIYLAGWNDLSGTDPFAHIATPYAEEI